MIKKCIFLLALIVGTIAADQLFVAVQNFEGRGISDDEVLTLTDKISGEMVNSDVFRVMSRTEMKAILMEQDLQNSEMCNTEECAVEVGQIIGVEGMVTGAVSKVGKSFSISINIVNVGTSEIMFSSNIEFICEIEELLTTHIPDVIESISKDISAKNFGSFSVITEPVGTTVLLDGVEMGETPFTSSLLSAGDYSVKLLLENYLVEEKKFAVAPGDNLKFDVTLKPTEEHAKTLHNEKTASKKKRQNIRRIVLGSLTVVCAAGGVGFNYLASEAIEDQEKYLKEYDSATENTGELKEKVEDAKSDAEKYSTIRNIFYGSAGAFAIGFSLSIPF